jgi:putative transposase
LIPAAKPNGRPREANIREVLNAIFYRLKNGSTWRNLPKDFPPFKTVYHYFREWTLDGTIEKIHDILRRAVRKQAGKPETPTAGSIDSQSVKTTSNGGARGYDAGKKTKGRKRHICVDTLGLIWSLVVHEAHIQDRDGAKLVFLHLMKTISTILLIWADGGYAGPLLLGWLQQRSWDWKLEIVKRTDDMKGFVLLPHRWIVERTFGWLESYRLLAKEYEKSVTSSQSNIYMAMIQIMVRRLEA